MIRLLLIITASSLVSLAFRKKIHCILPIFVMASALILYIFSLVIPDLTMAARLTLCVLIVFSGVLFFIKRKNLSGAEVKQLLLTPQFFIFLSVALIFAMLYSGRKIFDWDDFSYWGIYAKDLLLLDKLPAGVENCTISYKDYPPIVQLLQYFFLKPGSTFTEAGLFQVNICFLYLLMLPFLDVLDKHRSWIARIAVPTLYILFPHLFTTQFYYKLGVDYLISVLFGYGLYVIGSEHFRSSRFKMPALAITASFLALIKTSGIVLSLFLIVFFVFCTRRKEGKRTSVSICLHAAATGILPLLFYFSWKYRGRVTGNHGYLSDIVDSNIKSLKLDFPPYTKSVVLNYIKHFFTHPLTRDRWGMTAFLILCCILGVYLIRKRILAEDDRKYFRRFHFLLMIGLVIFCLAHLYMYLFVFDDWEASGLLEFDRYICQYLAGVFYYYSCSLWDDTTSYRAVTRWNPVILFCLLFVLMLPYRSIFTYMIPANYRTYYEKNYKPFRDYALRELEDSGLSDLHLPYDEDHRLMLVANGWLDELQCFTLELVPQPVTVVANVPAVEEGNLYNYICSLSKNNHITYVYVMKEIGRDYHGDFNAESAGLTVDGSPLLEGTIYIRSDRDGEVCYKPL